MRQTDSDQTPEDALQWMRKVLTIFQIVLMLVFLYGTVLLLSAHWNKQDTGLEGSGLLMGRLEALRSPQAEDIPRQRAMIAAWMTDVSSMPGVEALALSAGPDTPVDAVDVIMRTQAAPAAMVDTLQNHLERITPELRFVPLISVPPSTADASTDRFNDAVAWMLAIVSLIAAVKLCTMMAGYASMRFRELGALQAPAADRNGIIKQVLGESARQMGVGFAIGLPLALLVSWIIFSPSYEVNWFDPLSLLAVLGLLSVIGLAAHWLPMYRILKAKPTDTLRA